MVSASITFKNSLIHFRHGGHGPRPLICFHGYGESSQHFDFLEKKISGSHHIVAIDMPVHGSTVWNDGLLQAEDLPVIVTAILDQLQLPAQDMHLLGFSMGGRMALCVLQHMPSKVSRLVLLAPDGLTVNFWYWLSTQSRAGKRLFKFTMSRPGWFMGMLRLSNKLRIINPSIFKFVEYYIHDEKVRKALYERWIALSRCTPNLQRIREIIRERDIPVRLLYGKFDRIIGTKKGARFISGLDACGIEVLDCGHQVLHEKNADSIVKALFP